MMAGEFHYRLRRTATGQRPGSHAASTVGAGHHFAGHARLFDRPDPRRIDLRASLRDVRREWLVRTHLQRAAVPVYAVVDVSASMNFGATVTKLGRAADLVESMGNSAFRAGDPAGLLAFDAAAPAGRLGPTGRADPAATADATGSAHEIAVPARHSRGIGSVMGDRLRASSGAPLQWGAPGRLACAGLQAALEPLAGREALVFLISDFHWPLPLLGPALDLLNRASVIPVVVWDRAEIDPPAASGLLRVTDAETHASRTVWVGSRLRARWVARIAARRDALNALFTVRDVRPFYLLDAFDPVALSRHFMDDLA